LSSFGCELETGQSKYTGNGLFHAILLTALLDPSDDTDSFLFAKLEDLRGLGIWGRRLRKAARWRQLSAVQYIEATLNVFEPGGSQIGKLATFKAACNVSFTFLDDVWWYLDHSACTLCSGLVPDGRKPTSADIKKGPR
jgi:hypothetical protein